MPSDFTVYRLAVGLVYNAGFKKGASVHFLVVLGYQAQLLHVAQSWMNMQFLLTKQKF